MFTFCHFEYIFFKQFGLMHNDCAHIVISSSYFHDSVHSGTAGVRDEDILRDGERTEDNITAVDQAQARLEIAEERVMAAGLAASMADGGPAQPPPAAAAPSQAPPPPTPAAAAAAAAAPPPA